MSETAIIIGAGPAGLTAAYELVTRTSIKPIIVEKSNDIGGLCTTINYKGNRLDIGGHRFFSKSDRVMDWWLNILPLDPKAAENVTINYHGRSRSVNTSDIQNDTENEKVMLIRKRISRIYYHKKFYDYPLSLSFATMKKLGFTKLVKIAWSYGKIRLRPLKEVNSLQDFFINRFGKELYTTFFRDYTEKVWGVPCDSIPAEWGAQRIKQLSIGKAVLSALQDWLPFAKNDPIAQKEKQTSLIEQFLYPKYGPGQLWEEVARRVKEKGGDIFLGSEVSKINHAEGEIKSVELIHNTTGECEKIEGDYFFSSMPVVELANALDPTLPHDVKSVANGLAYRDFITVGLLLKKLKLSNDKIDEASLIPDTWIYMQDAEVRTGRIQIYNNWSPYMVKDPETVWIGLEYFCTKGDFLWSMPDKQFVDFATQELIKIGFIDAHDVLDSTIIRMEKTYPAYVGTYSSFDVVKNYMDKFSNLFLVGRNGMHKYNNSDHSMLTAMTAVDNIINDVTSKQNIWDVNAEQDYHETKDTGGARRKIQN